MGKPLSAGQYRPVKSNALLLPLCVPNESYLSTCLVIVDQLESPSVGGHADDHVAGAHAQVDVEVDGVLQVVEVAGIVFLVLGGAVLQGGVVTGEPKLKSQNN